MGISRISTSHMVEQSMLHMQNHMLMLSKYQDQVATGKKMQFPSDDPVGMAQLLRIKNDMDRNAQYVKNIDMGLAEIATTDSALTSIVEITHRVKEIAVKGANAATSAEERTALSQELDALINQLVQLGNTTHAGRYVFGGYVTNTATFTVAGANIVYNGTASAVTYQRTVEAAQGMSVAVNLHGQTLLGSTAAASGLFYILPNLKTDLQSGNITNIRAAIDTIQTETNRVLSSQTDLAGRANQLQMMKNRYEDINILQSQEMSQIQDVDLPTAISQMNIQQTAYQASMGVLAKIFQTSILDYLR